MRLAEQLIHMSHNEEYAMTIHTVEVPKTLRSSARPWAHSRALAIPRQCAHTGTYSLLAPSVGAPTAPSLRASRRRPRSPLGSCGKFSVWKVSDLSALVDVTSYHVDIHQHLPGFTRAKARHISLLTRLGRLSASARLASPGLLVEIRATAAYPGSTERTIRPIVAKSFCKLSITTLV